MYVFINFGHVEGFEKSCLKMSAALDVAGPQASKVHPPRLLIVSPTSPQKFQLHDVSINVSYLIGNEKYIWKCRQGCATAR